MKQIRTKRQVLIQLTRWRNEIGLGFHPDTLGHDYVTRDGTPLFTGDQAKEYDAKIQQCFEACDRLQLDFYGLALDCFLPLLKGGAGRKKQRSPSRGRLAIVPSKDTQ